MKEYVQQNKITDILFANNIFQACGGRYRAYDFFLTMAEGCKDNPSTAFYKNRVKETDEVMTDSATQQQKDSVVVAAPSVESTSDPLFRVTEENVEQDAVGESTEESVEETDSASVVSD